MKKILLLLAAVGLSMASHAQFMVGLQGGYFSQKNTNSLNDDYTSHTDLLGGLQLGYQIKKVYVGAFFNYESSADKRLLANSTAYYSETIIDVTDSTLTTSRAGFTVGPVVRVQVLTYGNMAFHLLLQGSYSKHGYTKKEESYVAGPVQTVLTSGEYIEPVDPYYDSVSTTMLNFSIRPTITYEFSPHFSAELTLDLLSIGYASRTDADEHRAYGQDEDIKHTTTTLYAGVNSFREALKWESPMLRLGFHYKF